MNYKEIIFSPTDGTAKVCTALGNGLGKVAETIDLTRTDVHFEAYACSKNDVVIIGVPSYGGRAVAVAMERLSKIKGNGARAVLVCVYGNRAYEDTLVELQDTASKAGFEVVAAVAAVAEHCMMRQYATNRPDVSDVKELEEIMGKIKSKIESGEAMPFQIPGNRPYKKTGAALVPKTGKGCTACGTCEKGCPVGAIKKDDFQHTDKSRCIGCMRCVKNCPVKARSIEGVMLTLASKMIKKECTKRKGCEVYL